MIQSKLQGLKIIYTSKLDALCKHWSVDRGSSKARGEAANCRKQLEETGLCIACHRTCSASEISTRYEGVCNECGMAFSSMLATKTKIRHKQPVGILALTRLRDRYKQFYFVPIQLRGNATPDEIVKCLDDVIEAKQAIEDYKENIK